MSNTNNKMQNQTSSTLHNAIMEVGGKDRPLMLAPGNYIQWKSRIKRYIDTKPNHELIHLCLKNPPYQYKFIAIDADATPTTPVDACPNAMEMWKANERLKQGESINVQDLETNLYWEFVKFTSQDGESLDSYYSRRYDNQRAINVVGARENVGTQVVQQTGIQCFNCKEFGHVARECKKPKRARDSAYQKEKMLLCKQDEAVIQLSAEQANWRDDTDDEPEDQELEHITCAWQRFKRSLHMLLTILDPSLMLSHCKRILEMENELSTHKRTISIISSQKAEQEKLFKTREDNGIEKVIILENQVKVLNEIVYKTGQSVQTLIMLNRNCKTSFVKPQYLKKAQSANPLYTKLDEVTLIQCDYFEALEKCQSLESEISKRNADVNNKSFNELSKRFFELEQHSINLELALQYYLKAQLQDKNIAIRVISTTSVSRPQLKSNQLEDRVLRNNSQVKKKEVEEHIKNFKFSKNKTSVTACNDSVIAKTLNVNFVCVTCGKCVLNDNHDLCILHCINGVNSRTKKPIDVPISTREPKQTVNQSVASPHRKIVASKYTIQNSRSTFRKLYEHVSTVRFGNDQFALILRYGDLVQGNVTIKRKSTCYVRDLKGNDLLTGSRRKDLYLITLQETTSPNPICLMAKAASSQAWLWHRRLSHLNFDTINLLSKNDIVIGLPKLKFVKDHLCSSCELGKAKQGIEHQTSTARTPEQNDIVKRQNRTLVEAARTMSSAAKIPLFFWAEAIATEKRYEVSRFSRDAVMKENILDNRLGRDLGRHRGICDAVVG
ncbi:retrovirus-related pol polyprotein from transposon TNT 1-94 [Tanacetum coccineum]